jgi:hypothetical protein
MEIIFNYVHFQRNRKATHIQPVGLWFNVSSEPIKEFRDINANSSGAGK